MRGAPRSFQTPGTWVYLIVSNDNTTINNVMTIIDVIIINFLFSYLFYIFADAAAGGAIPAACTGATGLSFTVSEIVCAYCFIRYLCMFNISLSLSLSIYIYIYIYVYIYIYTLTD